MDTVRFKLEELRLVSGEDQRDLQILFAQSKNDGNFSAKQRKLFFAHGGILVVVRDVTEHSVIVGMASLLVLHSLVKSGGYIGHVCVERSVRRNGIASDLLIHLVARAKGLGLSDVRLTCNASNPGTNALYQGLGFEPAGKSSNRYKIVF